MSFDNIRDKKKYIGKSVIFDDTIKIPKARILLVLVSLLNTQSDTGLQRNTYYHAFWFTINKLNTDFEISYFNL